MNRLLTILPVIGFAALAQAQSHDAMPAPVLQSVADDPSRTTLNAGVIGRLINAAKPGDTVRVPAGFYPEHLRIDKPLTLIGEGRPIIDGGGSGDIVEIAAADVTLKGFDIRNTGIDLDKENAGVRALAPRAVIEDNVLDGVLFGIDLREAPDSVIRNNRIGSKALDIARRGDGVRLWRADRTLLEGNTIHDGRDVVLWYSQGIVVRGNVSSRCRYGLHLMYSDNVLLEDNHLAENSVGVYIMYSKDVTVRRNILQRNRGPSGYGLGLKETDRFTVEHNLIVGNRVGVYLDGSPFTTSKPGEFTRNTIAYNDVGITFLPAVRGNQLTENNFIDNIEQVSVAGRGELKGNMFWKGEIGNFWTDYVGYDQNHDGVGDFVHESHTLFENLMDREPKLRLLLFSPTQQAIEFIGRALPAIRPEPKFTDEVPLMRPVPIDCVATGAGGDRGMLAAAALSMLAVGSAVLWMALPGAHRRRRSGETAPVPALGGVA